MKYLNVLLKGEKVVSFPNVNVYFVDENDRDLCILSQEDEWIVFTEYDYSNYWESEE